MTGPGRFFRSAGRFAGLAFALAVAMIGALAVVVALDLRREAELHREVMAAQEVLDALDRLRLALAELRSAARIAAMTGGPQADGEIERRAAEVGADLAILAPTLGATEPFTGFEPLSQSARLLVIQARSVPVLRESQGARSASDAAAAAAPLAEQAMASALGAREALQGRLSERTLARLRLGEGIRTSLAWLLGAGALVLAWLFAGYRLARSREAATLRRVERLAHWDVVTGLPNRALLSERLAQELSRARREGGPLALVMFDLDGFKAVNDTLGHAAGDRLLLRVGERCRQAVRASDTVGRLSGDEFLALLPMATAEAAVEVAEKLRSAIEAPYALDGGTARVSASFGIAAFPTHGDDPDALVRAADVALYESKRGGKNQVRVAPAAAPLPEAEPA